MSVCIRSSLLRKNCYKKEMEDIMISGSSLSFRNCDSDSRFVYNSSDKVTI